MCQLNLYLIPKSVDKEFVFGLMNKYFKDESHEFAESEKVFENKLRDYNVFTSSIMNCNCNTVQGYYNSQTGNLPWGEFKQKMIDDEFQKCLDVKNTLIKENFYQEFETFCKKLDSLSSKTLKLAGKAQIKASNERIEFLNSNSEFLDIFQKLNVRDLKIKSKEQIIADIEQDFAKFKDNLGKDLEKEFDNIYNFIKDLLEKTNEISLLSFWQDGEEFVEVNNEKTVEFKNLKIEDLVYLNYNDVLVIKKI